MMGAFTDAQTLAGVIPAVTPFASTPAPALVPDENANATATTPPSSPAYNIKRLTGPCTPTSNSTPLHRRFLRSISMSPAIPSPSTPTRNSPAKARPTPAHRKSESPIKLEVGQNAFYFSIELPVSKITPKKNGTPTIKATTPGRDIGTPGTPTKTPTVKELAARYQETDSGTPTRKSSPLKHASPVKEDHSTTPARTRSPVKQSPAGAPLGTPKSNRAPRVETGSGTPTQRAPTSRTTSPLKRHGREKRSPARALFGTPTKKGVVGMPHGSRPGSPVKRAIERLPTEPEKMISKLAGELLSKPTETLRIPPECLLDVTEGELAKAAIGTPFVTETSQVAWEVVTARPAAKSRPETIGHLMASLRSGNVPTMNDRGVAEDVNPPQASPAPTPLRKASQKLGLAESPSFLRFSANRASEKTNGDVKAGGSPAPHHEANGTQQEENQIDTTSSKATEGTASTQTAATRKTEPTPVDISFEAQPPRLLTKVNPELSTAFDMRQNEQTAPPLLFPKPEPEPEADADELPLEPESEKRDQGMDNSKNTKNPPRAPTIQHRRIGTDPSVILKMQQEMTNLEVTMRRSAEVVDPNFCGPLNLNELPSMSNSFFSSRRAPADVRSPGAIGTPRLLSRADSNSSSIETVRASMVTSAQNQPQLTRRASSTPKIPRWKPSCPTPAQAKRERLQAVKQIRDEKMSGPGTPRSRAESSASAKSSKSGAVGTATPRKALISPTAVRLPSSPPSRIPAATPAKFKTPTTVIPRSARRPTVTSPNPKPAVAALAERLSNLQRKSPQKTLQLPESARLFTKPEPYNPLVDHRPYEQKFASAVDIANRLKEWHEEDRRRAEAETPRSKLPIKTPPKVAEKSPTRTFIKAQTKIQSKDSTTPAGSPTKPLTPIKESTTPSPPKQKHLLSNPKTPSTPKPSHHPRTTFPKTPLPRTPAARNPTLTRVKQAAPKTPANRRTSTLDRNATRTPSKNIVSSLDKAIDEKIAEEVRSGREFTPGGNRVATLLDARGR
jgi:hypothetical protein